MHYIITNRDKPESAELRMEVRDAHVTFLKSHHADAQLVMAGPLLNDDGGMVGSHLVVVADDLAAVQRFQESDPMAQAGVFESSLIEAWKWIIGNPDAAPHEPD